MTCLQSKVGKGPERVPYRFLEIAFGHTTLFRRALQYLSLSGLYTMEQRAGHVHRAP